MRFLRVGESSRDSFLFAPETLRVNEIIERRERERERERELDQLDVTPDLHDLLSSSSLASNGMERSRVVWVFPVYPTGVSGGVSASYRIDMTALRVARSKIISNAIVRPSSSHYLPRTLDKPCLRVFAKFEGNTTKNVLVSPLFLFRDRLLSFRWYEKQRCVSQCTPSIKKRALYLFVVYREN